MDEKKKRIELLKNSLRMYENTYEKSKDEHVKESINIEMNSIKREIELVESLDDEEFDLYMVYPRMTGYRINFGDMTKEKLREQVDTLKKKKEEMAHIIDAGNLRISVGSSVLHHTECAAPIPDEVEVNGYEDSKVKISDYDEPYEKVILPIRQEEKSENTPEQMMNTIKASHEIAEIINSERNTSYKLSTDDYYIKQCVMSDMGVTDYKEIEKDEKLKEEYDKKYAERKAYLKEREEERKKLENFSLENKIENRKAINCQKYEVDELYSIREPFRKYGFIVRLPEKYNVKLNEIKYFSIDRQKKRLLVDIRETVGAMQIKNFLDGKCDNLFKRIFGKCDDIISVSHLDVLLDTDYVNTFNGVRVKDVYESALEYESEKNSLHNFTVEFSYKSEKIEKFTKEDEKATNKKQNDKACSKKESIKTKIKKAS